jgi:CBS domain-containing protein
MSQARDFMTKDVVTVPEDATVPEIAKILLDHAISAVPVVDATGAPSGMVSEGDLIARTEVERNARHDWWLALLAEGEALAPKFLASLHDRTRTAREVMSAPVITIQEKTDIQEIFDLLETYRIKRLPVVRESRIKGIVSRADVLRALAVQVRASDVERRPHAPGLFSDALFRLDDRFSSLRSHRGEDAAANPIPPKSEAASPSAAEFRALIVDSEQKADDEKREAKSAKSKKRHEAAQEIIEYHVTDGKWKSLLRDAEIAARHGEKDALLLRFPTEACTDGARAINAAEPAWPATLRGEPAELYLRWEQELKPRGFHLSARVIDFPDGLPGDVGLFLTWGGG